jgi:hypothetical protein
VLKPGEAVDTSRPWPEAERYVIEVPRDRAANTV